MKKKNQALVILNGFTLKKDYLDFFWKKHYLHICADGSYHWIKKLGLIPEFVIGDFDSIEKIPNTKETQFIQFSSQDTTDSEKILLYLYKKKISSVTIIGLIGDRLDHLFWNLNLIKKFQKKFQKIDCFTPTEKIIISNRKRENFTLPLGSRVSLFPFYKSIENIHSNGLKYELKNKSLSFNRLVSISNKTNKKEFSLKWKKGFLAIFLEHQLI